MGTGNNRARGRGICGRPISREFADRIAPLTPSRFAQSYRALMGGTPVRMFRLFTAALLALAVAAPAIADPWTGVDPARRPKFMGAGDIDFVVAELCFPYLINEAAPATLVERPLVVRMPRPPAFAREGAYMVGKADTVVAFEERNGARNCTFSIGDGDPEELRATLQKRLDQLPGLQPAARQLPPNTYARRESFCSAPDGPQYMVLISTRSLQRRGPKIMVTLMREPVRGAYCDAPSLPQAPPPPPATTL